eukprot:TRINITY_DN5779_c0_g3_i7.p1 TRINITY_DN5779_c0_g3~~TRINITY_DN5779_c0_g3_i7.p1  ORF type:complete len:246 (-),score=28.64 TRINITY_DN5779_c0_g3_i7:431-1168(-)
MAPKKHGHKYAANGKQRKQSSKEGSRLTPDTRQQPDTENGNNTTQQTFQNEQHVNGLDYMPNRDFKSFQNEIEILRQQLEAARLANRQLRENSINRMQEVFQICEEKIKVQDQKMLEMTQVCRNQNQMMDEFFKENQALKEELGQSKQLLGSLQQEKNQNDEHINSLETLNKNLEQQRLEAQQQYNQLEKEFQEFEEQYSEEIKSKRQEHQQFSLQLQEKEQKIQYQQNTIEQLTVEVQQLKGRK